MAGPVLVTLIPTLRLADGRGDDSISNVVSVQRKCRDRETESAKVVKVAINCAQYGFHLFQLTETAETRARREKERWESLGC